MRYFPKKMEKMKQMLREIRNYGIIVLVVLIILFFIIMMLKEMLPRAWCVGCC